MGLHEIVRPVPVPAIRYSLSNVLSNNQLLPNCDWGCLDEGLGPRSTGSNRILQKREIDFQSMSIVHRHLPNTTPDKVKTLLVTATASHSSDPWVLFLDDCYTLLAVGLEAHDIKIEIIDPRVVLGKLIYPIGLGDEIIEIWPILRPKIHRELDGKDLRAM